MHTGGLFDRPLFLLDAPDDLGALSFIYGSFH
jgi:hypothetical protein